MSIFKIQSKNQLPFTKDVSVTYSSLEGKCFLLRKVLEGSASHQEMSRDIVTCYRES